ncbi:MAG: hypothetical protein IJ837_03460 [Clostridia bacterium]|nr:hypothetical protein [Clostridia bacterium]
MAKSKIIKQLVNEEISLSIALKRLLILATDLNINELVNWVNCEIKGYGENPLPKYRKIKSWTFRYNGVLGRSVIKGANLDIGFFKKKTLDEIIYIDVRESISSIEEKAKSDAHELMIDRSYLAGEVYKNSFDGFDGLQCISISQIFSVEQFKSICNSVLGIVLDVLLELDKKFGNLDELDLDATKLDKQEFEETKKNIQVIINYSPITVEKDLNIKSENTVLGEGQITKTTDNKKIKDSNTGIGTNVVDKKFTPTLSIDGEAIKKIIKGN